MCREYYEENFDVLKKGENNSIILVNPKNDLAIMGFSGRAKKNYNFYYKFPNLNKRNEYIENFLKSQEEVIKRKEIEKQKKMEINNENIEIGTIYYTSWGYEQTNGEFYQVVDKKGKKTLLLKEIKSKEVEKEAGRDYSYFNPVKDEFVSDEIFEIRIDSLKIGKNYKKNLHKYQNKAVYRSWYY